MLCLNQQLTKLLSCRKGKLGAMFELSSEPVGPSFCDASTETKRRARSGLEAEACNSIPLEDVRLTPLESGPTDRAGHKLQIRGVTFLTLSECKLAGGRSYRRVQRRDERGLTGTVSSNVSRLPENPVSLRSRPRSAARLRSQALAAASLSQSLNQTPAFEEPSIHSASNLQPALEANVQKKRRSAGFFSQEQGANLLQNLAKVSIPWLRYTRFSVAQTRAIMRNIPLLERAGLGALAGGLAGGFTNATLHPLDTVKTKLQTKGGTALYTGAWDVVRKVGSEVV